MRVLLLAMSVLCVALPARAVARPKPKIAVAPLDGDSGNKVAQAVADALAGKDFAVVGPKEVRREMTKLGLPDELDARATRKLTGKLGAIAVIDGKVSKAGRKRTLHLQIHRRGKPDDGFSVEFKTPTSAGFRRGVHDEIARKLEGATEEPADTDTDTGDDDEARPAPFADTKPAPFADDGKRRTDDDGDGKRRTDDDGGRKRTLADDDGGRKRAPADDDGGRKRTLADDDATRRPKKPASDERKPRRTAAADDEDAGAVRKRKRRRATDDADDADAPPLAARVGAGLSVAQRQLAFDTRSGFTQVPPRVLTTAGAGRVDGEIYPLLLTDPSSKLAGLGLAATYDRTFGLAIKVPNRTVSAPIRQQHYAIGARYRFGVGEASSIALGLDYAHRQYIADRSGLMGAVLDAPDVEYTALAPGAQIRVPITSSVVGFGSADGLLILGTGQIQQSSSYGPATVYGLEGTGGVDVALTRQIGLRVALEFSQIMFTFKPKGSTMANSRDNNAATQDVNGASDRSIGVAATLGLVY